MNNIELKYILVSLLSLKAQMNINGPALINKLCLSIPEREA